MLSLLTAVVQLNSAFYRDTTKSYATIPVYTATHAFPVHVHTQYMYR